MRSNAMMNTGAAQVDARELIAQLATVRQKGYAFTCDLVTRGGGIIAALLPRTADQPEIVIGIGGISEVMRSREYQLAAILKQQIESRFGRQQRKDAAPPLRDNGMGGFRVKHTGSRFALS
jgi:DNA-binding IclR family transcriptional regulator